MFKKIFHISTGAVLAATLSFTAMAQDFTNQWDIKSGTTELVFPGMSPQDVAGKVKSALSQWSIPANLSYRSMPSVTPERPDEPTKKQDFIQGAPIVEYHCPTAYAEIVKRPPPVRNSFAFIIEITQACFYNFQKGVKVHLIMTRAMKTESLTSGLFKGITSAIQGSDGERITKELNGNIASIRKEVPSVLVERIEVPEMPVQEPDKEAVAKIIPAKREVTQQVVQQVQAAPGAVAAAPVKLTSTQQKIEARKNLTGMGMSYHSQEQFVASIQRKDDVAVMLFLDGGGINLEAKDASGKTPLEVAKETGNADIIKMIEERVIPKPTPEKPKAAETQMSPTMVAKFRKSCAQRHTLTTDIEKNPEVKSALDKLPPDVAAKRLAEHKADIQSWIDFYERICQSDNAN